MISTLIHLILIQEDIRPAWKFHDVETIRPLLIMFPDLHLFQFGEYDYYVSKQFITKKDLSSDEKIGKLLGYPSYRDYKKHFILINLI